MSAPQQWDPQPTGPERLTPAQVQTWSAAAHWSALVGGFALGGLAILGPLAVLLVKGDESAKVRRNAIESLNFQLSILLYGFASAALLLVFVGVVLVAVVIAFWIVFTIVGTVRTASGEDYRYPLTIRFAS